MTATKKTLAKAMLVMLLWGSLFPFIKLGYNAFGIDTKFVPNLLLFAGLRFLISGIIIAGLVRIGKQPPLPKGGKSWLYVLAVALFAVILHYACTYIGLSKTTSGITALLKQIGAILFICFSFLFMKDDRFEWRKIIAAVLGLSGILALNIGEFSADAGIGELLVIGASFCTVFSGIYSKKAMKSGVSPITLTCWSQLIGGAVLTSVGLLLGGSITVFTAKGALIFAYILASSVTAYCLWNSVLKNNDLSYMLIIKFFEPLFAAVFGALLLGEDILNIRFLLAVLFTLGALLVISLRKKK